MTTVLTLCIALSLSLSLLHLLLLCSFCLSWAQKSQALTYCYRLLVPTILIIITSFVFSGFFGPSGTIKDQASPSAPPQPVFLGDTLVPSPCALRSHQQHVRLQTTLWKDINIVYFEGWKAICTSGMCREIGFSAVLGLLMDAGSTLRAGGEGMQAPLRHCAAQNRQEPAVLDWAFLG